jgi:ribosomal subunit interface protein
MRLQVRGRNMKLSPSMRAYAEGKLARLDKQLAAETSVDVELASEAPARHTAEATVFTKGPTLRASESTSDMRTAIDRMADSLERQVIRYREKRRHDSLWAIAARKIEIIRLPGVAGTEIELASHDGERTLRVDGEQQFGSIPALERPDHVVRGRRIAGDAWEVEAHQL